MYLPEEILNARILITVKTYPLPSGKYDELVCTAGILDNGKWIRIYPMPYRQLPYQEQYKKYHWLNIDLQRNTSDSRPESYRPHKYSTNPLTITDEVGTANAWAERKIYVLRDVETSMNNLIAKAKGPESKSLATLKPRDIIDFNIESVERDWKPSWKQQLQQMNIFDMSTSGQGQVRNIVRKLPYKYSYQFTTQGDQRPRQMMIEDWEIGALYWRCLSDTGGDENAANELVRKKYYDEFLSQKELFFFVGTTKQYHYIAPNPFVIIGVFYPPKKDQQSLFDFAG